MPSGLLAGKVIFITGGASGIGRECALAYAREGAQVAVADTNFAAAQKTVAELCVPGLAVNCDVGDGSAVEAAIHRTVSEFSALDAVHNNAGILEPFQAAR